MARAAHFIFNDEDRHAVSERVKVAGRSVLPLAPRCDQQKVTTLLLSRAGIGPGWSYKVEARNLLKTFNMALPA